jgi:hypothetical protein
VTTRRRQRDRVRKGSRDEEWHRMYNNCNNTYLRFQAPPAPPSPFVRVRAAASSQSASGLPHRLMRRIDVMLLPVRPV